MRLLPVVLGILVTASVGRPCSFSCPEIPVCHLVDQAEAIVIAETVELGDLVGEKQVRARMRVERWYKRSPLVGETFAKVVNRGDEFVGRRWFVTFVRDDETGEIVQAGRCTDEPVGLTPSKIGYLERWVTRSAGSPTTLIVNTRYDGVSVAVQEGDNRFEQVSQGGVASFFGIPAATYSFDVTAPGLEPEPFESGIRATVAENECRAVRFRLRPTVKNRVSGRVIGPEGEALTGLPVSLIRYAPNGFGSTPRSTSTTAGDEGEFVFEGQEPGRYWLAVNAEAGPARPYPTVFYPGVSDLGDAAVIDLDIGGEVADLEIRIPRRLERRRRVRVRILWSDGSPAPEGRVENVRKAFGHPSEYFRYSRAFDSVPADEQGWAEIEVYESLRYWVTAATPRFGLQGESLPFEIEPGAGRWSLRCACADGTRSTRARANTSWSEMTLQSQGHSGPGLPTP